MKILHRFRLPVLLMLALFMAPSINAQEEDFEQLIEGLRIYDFGSGLKEITAIEQMVMEAANNPDAQRRLASALAGLLETDAPYGCKQFVCRQLAIIGGGQEVPVLKKYLFDEEMSGMALYALARIDDPSVNETLRESLGRASGRIRLGIINTIGRRGDTNAIPQLSVLLRGEDEDAAGAAAEALGTIGAKTAAMSLIGALKASTGNLKNQIAGACLRCADGLLSDGDEKSASEMYAAMFPEITEPYLQAAVLRGLQKTGNPDAAQMVATALKSGDFQLQKAAVSLIPGFAGKKHTEKFARLLPGLSEQMQVMLITALRVKGDNAALPWIEKAGGSSDPRVRTAALEALGTIGNASHVALLAERAANGEAAEKEAARESLSLLKDPGANEQILSLLTSSDPDVQIELIDCLPARHITGGSGVLFKIIEQGNRGSRRAALRALGAAAPAEDVRKLINLMPAIEGSDKNDAETAVAEITKRTNAESISVPLLIERYAAAGDAAEKCSIIRVMAKIGDNRAMPLLRDALKEGSEEIRTEAVRGLSAWPNTEPLKDLFAIAQEAKEKTQGILALRGIIDLVEKDPASTPDEKLRLYQRAMNLAVQDAEKIRVLGKIGNIYTFPALHVAMSYMDGALTEEAARASVQIIISVYRENPGQVGIILDKILEKAKNETVLGDARMLKSWVEGAQWRNVERGFENTRPVSLFDGLSLAGWEGDRTVFRIEDGAIIAGSLEKPIPRNEFLCTEKRYRDFELRLKFKLTGARETANAGVQFRSERIPNHNEVKGYQADIGQNYWGSLYDESRRNRVLAQADMAPLADAIKYNDWNEYIIVCVGSRIILTLNGIQTVDYTESDDSIEQEGIIGLQIHAGPASEVRYKDITIKELNLSVPFKIHAINAESAFEAATILDVNNDGVLDIFCGGFWYEGPEWQKHFVRNVPERDGYYTDFAEIPMDVDRDGWTDILNGSWHDKDVFWVRNPGQSGGPFEVVKIDEPGNLETLIGMDISGDGRLDILPNTVGSLVWYEYVIDTRAPFGTVWNKHELEKEAAGHGLGAGDINGDGRVDIVTPKGWVEQPASPNGKWAWHKEFQLGNPSIPMLVHDVDGDGDADLIYGAGHGYGVFWAEQHAAGTGTRTWEIHEIDKSWSQAHYFLLADLDNDGQEEVLTGKRYHAHNGHDPGAEHPVCVYYYSFDRSSKQWTRNVLAEGGKVGFGIYTAARDIDGDGDVDVVAPGKSGLYLLENLSK